MEKLELIIEKDLNEEEILTVKTDRQICLHSAYDKWSYVNNWMKQFDTVTSQSVIFVFGVSDGAYIRSIRDIYGDVLIIAFELSLEIYSYFCSLNSNRELLKDDRFAIVLGDKVCKCQEIVFSAIDYSNRKKVVFSISPNYELLFPEEIRTVKQIIEYTIDLAEVNRNTLHCSGEKIRENISQNISDLIEQSTVWDFIKSFENFDKENIPAVIIASGPSLDKNVHLLKKVKNRFFLIACDSALKALTKVSVIPDVVVTVDPNKHLEIFESDMMKEVPLIMELSSNYKIRSLNKGKHFYHCSNSSLMDVYFEQYEIPKIFLDTGGSVANNAFSLAVVMGFRNIIFVGQDLAYPNDKQHASGAYQDTKKNVLSDEKEYFWVDDIYGEKVKTEYNMNLYRRWFEQRIQAFNTLRCIDATEGGAKIEGTEILTFQEAMDAFLPKIAPFSVESILENASKTFNDEQKLNVYESLAHLDIRMKDIRKKAREGIQLYEKLSACNRNQEYSSAAFQKTYNKITDLNIWVADNPETRFLSDYTYEDDYSVMDVLGENEGNIYEDLELLSRNGKKILDAVIKATSLVEQDYSEVIEYARKKVEER